MTEKDAIIIPRAKFSFEVPDALRRNLYKVFKKENAYNVGPVVMDATVENLEKWIQFVASLNDAMPVFDAVSCAEAPMYDLAQAQKVLSQGVECALHSLKEFELSIKAWDEHKVRAEARLALLRPALEKCRADAAKAEGAAKEAQEVCEVVAAAVARYESYRLAQL